MSNSTGSDKSVTKPAKLTYEDILSDLSSIPLNQKDVLFVKSDDSNTSANDDLYEQVEKYTLFSSNLDREDQQIDSDLSIGKLDAEFDKIEERLQNLQNFIDISEKFLAISNKQT